ncbi:MAG: zinc ribbon domain-containing protein [Candidatus Sumerlaeota bacterium]|nr:zinc ribbon domain-containing protein [Candidatus Sumerlaeota bacterium]
MTPNAPPPGSAVAFTAQERRTLLDEFFAVCNRLEDAPPPSLEGRSEPPPPGGGQALERHVVLRRTYREKAPVLQLSRCPFTKAVYAHSIDPYGIDGLWWDYRAPNRPLELLGGNIVAFTGAMRLGTPLESMPFLCRPGPGVPFVVPRILEREGVRAVISSLPIGVHTGYVIVYFGNPAPNDLEGFNDWGTDDYQFESGPDRFGWDKSYSVLSDYDFELEKWLVAGKLLWIATNDTELTLRENVTGCPYIGLKGIRKPQLIQDGEVWHEELWTDTVEDRSASTPSGGQRVRHQADGTPALPGQTRTTISVCGVCGMVLPADARFCAGCGNPISVPKPAAPVASVCPSCRNSISPAAKFCKRCGYKLIKS